MKMLSLLGLHNTHIIPTNSRRILIPFLFGQTVRQTDRQTDWHTGKRQTIPASLSVSHCPGVEEPGSL